jgi:hypothetical protein
MQHFVTENRYIVPLATTATVGVGGYAAYKGGEWLLDKAVDKIDGSEVNPATPVSFSDNNISRTIPLSDDDMMIADLLSEDIMDNIDGLDLV